MTAPKGRNSTGFQQGGAPAGTKVRERLGPGEKQKERIYETRGGQRGGTIKWGQRVLGNAGGGESGENKKKRKTIKT